VDFWALARLMAARVGSPDEWSRPLVLFSLAAFGLDFAELFEGPFELAGEAVLVHAQGGEGLGLLAEGFGGGQGGVHFRFGGVDAAGVRGHAEGEEVGFQGHDAVQTPGCVGDGLDQLFFGGEFGLVFGEEFLDMELVGGEGLGGHDHGLAGEPMAERVQRRTVLAGFGARASGFLGIGAVDGGAGGFAW